MRHYVPSALHKVLISYERSNREYVHLSVSDISEAEIGKRGLTHLQTYPKKTHSFQTSATLQSYILRAPSKLAWVDL